MSTPLTFFHEIIGFTNVSRRRCRGQFFREHMRPFGKCAGSPYGQYSQKMEIVKEPSPLQNFLLFGYNGATIPLMQRTTLVLAVKIILAAAILFGFLVINAKNADPDMGWHLKVGQEVAQTGSLPSPDRYSHTMPGTRWVNHEWLIDAALWWLSAHNLWWLATVLSSLLAFLPFFVWIVRAQNFGMLWLALLGAASITPFLGVRPQIVSFAFFFFLFELLRRYFEEGRQKKYLWALPAVFLLWANLHAGFFAGLFLFGAYAGAHAAARWLEDKKLNLRASVFPAAIFTASLAGTFLNAYGWKLHAMIFQTVLSEENMKYIAEFQPLYSYFDPSIILLTGIALIFTFRFFKRYPPSVLAMALLFLAMAGTSLRHWLFFIIAAQPFLSLGVGYLKNDIVKASGQKPFSPRTVGALHAFAVGAFLLLSGCFGYKVVTYHGMPQPEQAAVFLESRFTKDELLRQVVFNEYGWGGYFIWRVPDIKIFIDGRMPYWVTKEGRPILAEYMSFFKSEQAQEQLLEKYGVTMLILKNTRWQKENDFWRTHIPAPVQERMRQSPRLKKFNAWLGGEAAPDVQEGLARHGWRAIYQDSLAVILIK